jgi:hypothetical protein
VITLPSVRESNDVPAGVAALLDGTRLEHKVGTTVLVAAADGGWPRIATLSVGEVLVADPRTVAFTMYRASRTAGAIAASGHALLLAVDDGAVVRLRVDVRGVDAEDDGRRTFVGNVVGVERDAVPYARVTSGIEYEVLDPAATVSRWRRQLDALRAACA